MLYALIAVCALCVFLLVACYALCKQRDQAYKLARDERADCIRAEGFAERIDEDNDKLRHQIGKLETRIGELEELRDAQTEQISELNQMLADQQERLNAYENADDDSNDEDWGMAASAAYPDDDYSDIDDYDIE